MGTKIQYGLATHFENLVTGKTITQDQASKIKAIIHKAEATKKADLENTEPMTDHGCKIYMDNNKINYINSLKALVENGNITQAQAEKIIMRKIYLCQIKRLNSLPWIKFEG
ncbi:hypothetical protein LGK95_21975 [Clostridium algoriphilum]|uniref:hypothetical protein n=1 Tax=Clostridium algoriphilum TaxID=198347 RepID=UPI001CF3F092|nr:hypothetical protein [Clostridium algoriphilum]MCB2296120.1 hypothetical protein [Clostridium algoriphilum]